MDYTATDICVLSYLSERGKMTTDEICAALPETPRDEIEDSLRALADAEVIQPAEWVLVRTGS